MFSIFLFIILFSLAYIPVMLLSESLTGSNKITRCSTQNIKIKLIHA
jgi:hypothetical protein